MVAVAMLDAFPVLIVCMFFSKMHIVSVHRFHLYYNLQLSPRNAAREWSVDAMHLHFRCLPSVLSGMR